MSLFLGIDGGGTATTAALGDSNSILARASAGPSNIVRVGEEEAAQNLQAVVERVCAAAAVNPRDIGASCVGVAGASAPRVNIVVRRAVSELTGGAVEVVGDMVIAMEAAFGAKPGVVVIAGTGSIAFGRNGHNQTARAGGWGYAISDEGSGHWIGRNAVAALMRSRDAGEQTALAEAFLQRWNLHSPEELVPVANSMPPPDFSALFPLVLGAAESGDALARRTLASAGEELAKLAEVVIRRLWPPDEPAPVSLGGGVFRNSLEVRANFCRRLGESCSQAQVNSDIIDAVLGALSLARNPRSARL